MNIGVYSIRGFDFRNLFSRSRVISDIILKHGLDACALQRAGGFVGRRLLLRRLNQDFGRSVYSYYGGHVGVLYRRDIFTVFDRGSFSVLNPYSFFESVGSCVWVGLFDRRFNKKFYVFSVFLQRSKTGWGLEKRLNSLRRGISRVLGEIGFPFVLAGTFNFSPVDDLGQYFRFVGMFEDLKDANRDALLRVNENDGTYNGFGVDVPDLSKRFDYILSSGFRIPFCKTVEVRDDSGRFPSDHFPIVLICEIDG